MHTPEQTTAQTSLSTQQCARSEHAFTSVDQSESSGLDSPDDGDALALTFSAPVEPEASERDDEDEIGEFKWRVSSVDAWMVQAVTARTCLNCDVRR
jgi:hypothetical protein